MSAGVKKEAFSSDKPFIGIANSYNNIIPGHVHLNELTAEVKRGIIDAGGIPFEWGVPGICDGVAMFVEMRLSLPSREHVAGKMGEGEAEGMLSMMACGACGRAPGMPEMLTPTDAIKGAGYERVALVTDGRFSGATTGPCIGHVEPEDYTGGAIGVVRDGDIIDIDIPTRRLNVRISEDEIQARRKHMKIPERTLTPLLRSFRKKFSS